MSFLKLFFITIFCFALTESNANGNSADFADSHPLTLDGACKRSKLVVIAEYCNYEISRQQYLPEYQAISAKYDVKGVLKGDFKPSSQLEAEFELSSEYNYVPPKNWKFTKKIMPKKGSRWILFLTYPLTDGTYCTYRGSFGRMPYTQSLESEVIRLLN